MGSSVSHYVMKPSFYPCWVCKSRLAFHTRKPQHKKQERARRASKIQTSHIAFLVQKFEACVIAYQSLVFCMYKYEHVPGLFNRQKDSFIPMIRETWPIHLWSVKPSYVYHNPFKYGMLLICEHSASAGVLRALHVCAHACVYASQCGWEIVGVWECVRACVCASGTESVCVFVASV